MSVFPGFGGQPFIQGSLDKISAAKKLLQTIERPIWLAVDGGINLSNVASVVAAGANFCVVGSSLFSSIDHRQWVIDFRKQMELANLRISS